MKKLTSLLFAFTAIIATAQTPVRYGTGLGANGSQKPVHTIFTAPGEDASKAMNLSIFCQPGNVVKVEYTTADDTDWHKSTILQSCEYETENPFDSINSKLGDNTDVIERHNDDKHFVTLGNLKPSTDYIYRVHSDEGYISDTHRFRTAGDTAWTAAVIGDFHHYSPLWRRLDAAMGMVDVLDSVSGGFDWVLSTGDQCAWGGSFNYWTELAEQPAYKNYMWAAVEGNHDYDSRDKVRSDAYFRHAHNYPDNGYEGQIGNVYWFKYGDVLFLMLNNEAMRTAESLVPVFDWMWRVVDENPSKYIVVVQHYEWLIGTDGSNSQLDRFRDTFDALGVDLAIAGNNHAYIRTPALAGRTPVVPGKGTFYVVAPSSDDSRGRTLKPLVANEDIVAMRWSEGPHTIGAMTMDVDPSRIVMTLYDRHGKVRDTFTIPARR